MFSYGIRGYVWVTGQSRPIFVNQPNYYETMENAKAKVEHINETFERYAKGDMSNSTIVICNTLMKLDCIQAIQLMAVENKEKVFKRQKNKKFHAPKGSNPESDNAIEVSEDTPTE